jgi:hypothetical protein
MYQVICPSCKTLRKVEAKKKWMVGTSPFSKICKKCCQLGKIKTQEHKDKLRESVKQIQTEDVLKKKSDFMKLHPEIWQKNFRPELGPIARVGMKHSDESKKKIADGVRKAKGANNEIN